MTSATKSPTSLEQRALSGPRKSPSCSNVAAWGLAAALLFSACDDDAGKWFVLACNAWTAVMLTVVLVLKLWVRP